MARTTYLYDDPEHPERITGTVDNPEWTEEDRALLLALVAYEATLCPGCGQPQHLAWHAHTQEEWDAGALVCHACTAKNGGEEVTYHFPTLFLAPERVAKLPPFEIGKTTTEPTKKPTRGE